MNQNNDEKTPCINGCIMCGMCCVALTIDDENLQKPAFTKCQNLVYLGNQALCSIHDERQPQTCRDYQPAQRFKLLWFDERLKYYRQNDYMLHLLWMAQHGYLAHLPIIKALTAGDYSRAADVYKYFIRPYLLEIEGTFAARPDWPVNWPGLADYLLHAPGLVLADWQAMSCRERMGVRRSIEEMLCDIDNAATTKIISCFKRRGKLPFSVTFSR